MSAGGSNSSGQASAIQDYVVRVPKNQNKKFGIMRFNGSIGVDFTKWSQVKMERENNMVQFKSNTEELPKFGAGSEYGREQREEARRKKFGIISKKYKPEDQPWMLQYGGKTGKKFKGVREGGVTENASYYIFTQAADGAFEAFPVEEWYNFQSIQRYKALSIEEAEEEFSSRNRTLNLFNVMVRKRMMKNEEEGDEEGEEGGEGKGKGKKKKAAKGDLRISEMDDWESQSGGSSDEEDHDDDDDKKDKKKKKGKKAVKGKKKKTDGSSEDEPLEDSDDGDGEGREVDYISSSSDESDGAIEAKHELKGVAEEDALRRLLNSDEEDEDEEKEEEFRDKEDENEDAELEDEAGPSKEDKDDKKKKKKDKKKKDKKPRKEDYGSSSDSDSDSSISEPEKPKPSPKIKSADNSRSGTPTKPFTSTSGEPSSDGKRKMPVETGASAQQPKKARLDGASTASVSSPMANAADKDGVNEDSVRRYLSRKPMTTTELLQKFKSKRTGLSSDQLVHVIAQILKKINPVKQTIKGKMYLSIKA